MHAQTAATPIDSIPHSQSSEMATSARHSGVGLIAFAPIWCAAALTLATTYKRISIFYASSLLCGLVGMGLGGLRALEGRRAQAAFLRFFTAVHPAAPRQGSRARLLILGQPIDAVSLAALMTEGRSLCTCLVSLA
jgi:hypothetical protein